MLTIPCKHIDIIPHKERFVQAGIPPTTHETQTIYNFAPTLAKTGIQSAAYELYDMGLNVFPQPIAKKAGYPWKRLQFGRLNRDDKDFGLDTLFAGDCNLAVMCGATSGNLFVIDCESISTLRYHASELRSRYIPLWIVQTARGGHIYLRATEGEVHNIESGIMSDVEIRGQHGYVLAPPSIHPTGAIYTWLVREGNEIPTVSARQIDWLRDCYNNPITLDIDTAGTHINENKKTKGNWSYPIVSPCSNLSAETRDYIENGRTIPEGSRNNQLFKAACDMAGNSYTQDETDSILGPIAAFSGLHPLEIKLTITSAFSKPRTPSRIAPKPVTPNATWRYALLWLRDHPWCSKTAATNRAVFSALIERCRLSNREDGLFRASVREIAELARLSTITVQRALMRFQHSHYIQRVGNDSTSGASLWRFTTAVINVGKKVELNLNTVGIPPHWLRYSVSLFNSDATERGALGHGGMFIYQYLRTLEAPAMPFVVAQGLGVTVNQVNYALRKLCALGLVERLPQGWVVVGMTDAQFEAHIAEVTSVMGKGAARGAYFREKRQLFAGRLLLNARLRAEGDVFARAAIRVGRAQQAMEDPLIALAVELWGVVGIGDGIVLMAQTV